ncbi:hypothetical protein DUI87_21262 [Hirundo rustica rustica]|uniref:Uncharacterized protein n=1 Tax=Hirundo rustica rustica TaxID=333673 RepID=A0A3M0JTN9_HIRRU|nr:hypothetical protein DUI87_21262 [Hirundo rustica rustica]
MAAPLASKAGSAGTTSKPPFPELDFRSGARVEELNKLIQEFTKHDQREYDDQRALEIHTAKDFIFSMLGEKVLGRDVFKAKIAFHLQSRGLHLQGLPQHDTVNSDWDGKLHSQAYLCETLWWQLQNRKAAYETLKINLSAAADVPIDVQLTDAAMDFAVFHYENSTVCFPF